MSSVRLETWPVARLAAYARNNKKHTEESTAAIARSIRRYGFNDPIGVTPEGVIVEGHGRLRAAQQLGHAEVPVIVLEGLTPDQADRYRIAHNKIALNSQFDYNRLRHVLTEVFAGEAQLTDLGFTEETAHNIDWLLSPPEQRALSHRPYDRMALRYDVDFATAADKRAFVRLLTLVKRQNPGLTPAAALLAYAETRPVNPQEQHGGETVGLGA